MDKGQILWPRRSWLSLEGWRAFAVEVQLELLARISFLFRNKTSLCRFMRYLPQALHFYLEIERNVGENRTFVSIFCTFRIVQDPEDLKLLY